MTKIITKTFEQPISADTIIELLTLGATLSIDRNLYDCVRIRTLDQNFQSTFYKNFFQELTTGRFPTIYGTTPKYLHSRHSVEYPESETYIEYEDLGLTLYELDVIPETESYEEYLRQKNLCYAAVDGDDFTPKYSVISNGDHYNIYHRLTVCYFPSPLNVPEYENLRDYEIINRPQNDVLTLFVADLPIGIVLHYKNTLLRNPKTQTEVTTDAIVTIIDFFTDNSWEYNATTSLAKEILELCISSSKNLPTDPRQISEIASHSPAEIVKKETEGVICENS